ncbi:MAG: T9SS type A sorting domain-containing protein, partial [Bacteroidetes bacterium]|nr:T9SS type A sorting domain-containing protein [Bacteroidota bacterium]
QNTSTDTNAVHQFTGPGTYYVCLTVCNSIGCDTMCRALEIKTVGTAHLQQAGVSVSPNPASDFLQVDFPNFKGGYNLLLINTLGQVVLNIPLLEEHTEVYVGQLQPGGYFAQLFSDGQKQTLGKLMIVR